MAKRSKLRFPFTAVMDEVFEGEISPQKLRIATKTLQSSNVTFSGWNRRTLLGKLGTGTNRFLGIFYFQVQCVDSAPALSMANGEKVYLEEVFEVLKANGNFGVFFIEMPSYSDDVSLAGVSDVAQNAMISFDSSFSDFGFALATEATNFRTLRTIDGSAGTASTVCRYAEAAFKSLSFLERVSEGAYEVVVPTAEFERDLWHAETVFANDVDIEKITNEARQEQIEDTIKRLLDAAHAPRSAHLPTHERLISTQGFLWLTQVEKFIGLRKWILSTTLFAEVYPSFVQDTPPINYSFRKQADASKFSGLLNSFVKVPSGTYRIGRTQSAIPSEPPANEISVMLDEFWISKHLITEADWYRVFEGEVDTSGDLPKRWVSYFDAVAFCERLSSACAGAIAERFGNVRVGIPNEYQWEAAAAGPDGLEYPWGNSFDSDACNADMNIGSVTPVERYSGLGESPFGLLDMSGNLREWTRSYAGTPGTDWQEHHPDRSKQDHGAITALSRLIIRGGSYSYDPECVRTWVRNTQIAVGGEAGGDKQTGFRLVIEHE